MILPFAIHFSEWKKYPFTLLLVGMNILIYLMFFTSPTPETNRSFLDEKSLALTGRLYHQYISVSPHQGLEKTSWARKLSLENEEHLATLGVYALRDATFVGQAENMTFTGDAVVIQAWQQDLVSFRKNFEQQALYRFGLNSLGQKSLAWVTYQFSHAGFMHLLSNMIFLFLMGMAVESLVGGVGLLLLYLLGGFAGGAAFLALDSYGNIPMVGASASISALIAFFCFAELRKRVRFYYFLSPVPGQHGPIYLPTLLLIPFFLLADVGNLWAQPEGLGGGVAYAAHLGGSALGAVMALIYRFMISKSMAAKSTLPTKPSL